VDGVHANEPETKVNAANIRNAYYIYQSGDGYWNVAPLNDHRVAKYQTLPFDLCGRAFSSRESAAAALSDAASAASR